MDTVLKQWQRVQQQPASTADPSVVSSIPRPAAIIREGLNRVAVCRLCDTVVGSSFVAEEAADLLRQHVEQHRCPNTPCTDQCPECRGWQWLAQKD